MKRTRLIILTVTLIILQNAEGQYATRQAGIRSGYSNGIFGQISSKAGNAETGFCAIICFKKGIQLTGLRVIYETTLSEISSDLYLAYGFGGHAGFSYIDHYSFFGEKYYYDHPGYSAAIGADGWLSAEYRFHEVPLNISLNIKPFVELTIPSFVRIIPWDIGISVSYVF